jgi:hypothetical protein
VMTTTGNWRPPELAPVPDSRGLLVEEANKLRPLPI